MEVLDGRRRVRQVPVVGIVEEYMGTSAYMEIDALRRLAGEGDTLTGAFLTGGSALEPPTSTHTLKEIPAVAGVGLKRTAIESFNKTLADTFYVMIFFNLLFSGVIAGGVVYNAARVSLSERSRELASLRVLGFTRGEISFILLGELASVTLMAIPIGMLLGYVFAGLLVAAFNTELYRFPLVVTPADVRLRGDVGAGRRDGFRPGGATPAGSPGPGRSPEDAGIASAVTCSSQRSQKSPRSSADQREFVFLRVLSALRGETSGCELSFSV